MKLSLRSPCPVRPTLSPEGACQSACSLCRKTVHHLSRMTEAEGRALLARADSEALCVRYVADAQGEVVFAPALRAAAAAGLLAFTPVALADGGDVAIQYQAEQNRVHDELRQLGIAPEQAPVQSPEALSNAQQAQAAGTEPVVDPEPFIMYDGGI